MIYDMYRLEYPMVPDFFRFNKDIYRTQVLISILMQILHTAVVPNLIVQTNFFFARLGFSHVIYVMSR